MSHIGNRIGALARCPLCKEGTFGKPCRSFEGHECHQECIDKVGEAAFLPSDKYWVAENSERTGWTVYFLDAREEIF